MTAHRFTTTGNTRPHIVHEGYQDRPRVPGPIQRLNDMRPEGEPSLLVGALVVFAVFCLVPFIAAVMP